jgi:hypothetical protein
MATPRSSSRLKAVRWLPSRLGIDLVLGSPFIKVSQEAEM